MNQGEEDRNQPKQPDAVEIFAETMLEFRDEMEFYNNAGSKIAERTRLILKVGFSALIMSAVILLFMILKMADNMSTMTIYLEEMYSSFGSISENMETIAETVDLMGGNITGVPTIAESMIQIDRDVGSMSGSIHEIKNSMVAIDGDMTVVHSSMQEMTGRLSNVNHSVNLINRDVYEMSSPMNTGPMRRFWPK